MNGITVPLESVSSALINQEMKEASILIIDDEVDFCFLLGNKLQKRNYKVNFAHSLSEGFEKLSLLHPTIVFLDLNLPDGSGLDAIEKVKSQYPDIKIIIISAYDSSIERSLAREARADVFFGKPFNIDILFMALDHLMLSDN
jgi:two-component system, OmpR family, KDP operon response regulator KdpE